MEIWIRQAAQTTIERLKPRLEHHLPADANRQAVFFRRLETQVPRVIQHLHTIYGYMYDFFYHLEQCLITAARYYATRPDALHALDDQREADPLWFKRSDMMGAVCYVDLFADNLAGLQARIPYLKELGITYLHLMPLFLTPEGQSDGGYAISDFRTVDPTLGTMDDLAALADALRAEGISLVLDFVFNHTADTHIWAQRAIDGEEHYQDYYYMFPDRTLPDQYQATLREIFPEQAPGSFVYNDTLDCWVWATFNDFQWDLNYGNPAVFNAMLGEMLFLANQGTEILRLDAVAFIWKRMGTPCENLPEVHDIIRTFNALVQIAAPAMHFKSEAIVHPDDVASYIAWEESPISYNPTLMALLWESLATREVKLLRHSMSKRYAIPPKTAWVNYVRVHDDIGWSFADEDAAEMNINGYNHRLFLNQFYTGQFLGSFARGLGFNYNPLNQDMRITGTCASLCGLEQALDDGDSLAIDHAIKRILLIYSIVIVSGGIPLLYLGDEIAMLNDYSFRDDPDKADDNRWVHRPRFDWQRAEARHDDSTPVGRVFTGLQHLIQVRQGYERLADDQTQFFDTQNPHVLGMVRNRRVLVLANVSDQAQSLRRDALALYWPIPSASINLITDQPFDLPHLFTLAPYEFIWLAPA